MIIATDFRKRKWCKLACIYKKFTQSRWQKKQHGSSKSKSLNIFKKEKSKSLNGNCDQRGVNNDKNSKLIRRIHK